MSADPAPVRVTVEVSREDIAEGYPGACLDCPIALGGARAIRLRFGPVVGCDVRHKYLTFFHLPPEQFALTSIRLPLPLAALRFIRAFDRDRPVRSFAFDLVFPPQYLAPVTETSAHAG